MTEYTNIVEHTRRQIAFREWKNTPLYMHTENGCIITKFQDGRKEIKDTSTDITTYTFPEDYTEKPYTKSLFDSFLKQLMKK